MSTRFFGVVFDANDHIAQARWWSGALGLPVAGEWDHEAWLAPHDAPEIIFVPVPEPKTSKNRVHLDLASTSAEHQAESVQRLLALGASHANIAQLDTPWVVLADPEGNEFCVLEPREMFADSGTLASIVVDAADPDALASFWTHATGWPVINSNPWGTVQRASTGGPTLDFLRSDKPKLVKNRLHLDVAPFPDDDQHAEVERLVARGARRIDIGQGDVPWVVLADPEGNEFCVLTPR